MSPFVRLTTRLICAISLTLVAAYSLHLPLQVWHVLVVGSTGLFFAWWFLSWRKPSVDDQGARYYAVVRWLAKGYLALFGLRCKVKGTLALPAGPKILAANHSNATDPFFLAHILTERLHIMMQGSLFNLPFLGLLLSQSGQIPVWPECRASAFEQACELLRQGRTIWIFPEGRLNPSGAQLQAGTGAVRMSLATGAPIIPIGIHVADRDALCLSYRSKTGRHTGRWQVRGCCSFQFGEAWDPSSEVVPGGDLPPARFLTPMLMEKIYTLAHVAREECVS
jgi:1-acyl-sn-glycerol-3-phosphate acyltransferase